MKILERFADGTIKRASVRINNNFGMATVVEVPRSTWTGYTLTVEGLSYKVESRLLSADEIEVEVARIVKAIELLVAA